MKACFPIVGEKEYKDSILRTKRRQCVFTKLRVESVFISFVSISFNKLHVSIPTRTSVRVIGEIRVPNRFVLFVRFVFKKISCSSPAANKIRESEIRVRIKNRVKSVCV